MGTLQAFAGLLEYPDATLPARIDACVASLTTPPEGGSHDSTAAAAEALRGFKQDAERLGRERLQEGYIAAFDLDAECTLDVGHHLFGYDMRRSLFLCQLAGRYQEARFAGAGTEAPDSLAVMLRYLDGHAEAAERAELIGEVIVPVAGRIASALEGRRHPYAPVLRALLAVLAAAQGGSPGGKGAMA